MSATAPYATDRHSPQPMPDNLAGGDTAGMLLDKAVAGAHTLDVCTGYVSATGILRLLQWSALMDGDAPIRLLIGMPPSGWSSPSEYGHPHRNAEAVFLRRHLAASTASSRNRQAWERLGEAVRSGRVEVRLRLEAPHLHAKHYAWSMPDGRRAMMIGSSNLTGAGLGTTGQGRIEPGGERPGTGTGRTGVV